MRGECRLLETKSVIPTFLDQMQVVGGRYCMLPQSILNDVRSVFGELVNLPFISRAIFEPLTLVSRSSVANAPTTVAINIRWELIDIMWKASHAKTAKQD